MMNLESLDARIAARATAAPEESYTARLLQAGMAKCAKKLGEEAVELAIAAMDGDKREVAAEAADLVYHFLVLLKAAEVSLDEVMAELDRRTAQSGLEEKASRKTLS
jgi:phosphoribosyl-ATP pyrophosphohydrolase